MKFFLAFTRLAVVIVLGTGLEKVLARGLQGTSSSLADAVIKDIQEFESVPDCIGRCSRTLKQEVNSTMIPEPSQALEPAPGPIQEILDFQMEMDWNPASCYGFSGCEESKQVNAFTISEMTVQLDENGSRNIQCMDKDSQEARDLRVTDQLSQSTLRAMECIFENSAGENEELWKDVYITEGSCTGLPVGEYFDMMVKLYTLVNPNKIIYDMGITNGTSVVQREVDRDTLLNAVSNVVGKKAWIGCNPEIMMLRYVQVCVDSEPPFDIVDCEDGDPLGANEASCDGMLSLPTISSGGYVSEECQQYNPYGVSRSGILYTSSATTVKQTLLIVAYSVVIVVIHGSTWSSHVFT
ncbi:hypothetical protein M9435_003536 [Picochlorum sp. BPE23]|nr:hypothetical protein M9435_003536 [Picochlorum sp. BPE23]